MADKCIKDPFDQCFHDCKDCPQAYIEEDNGSYFYEEDRRRFEDKR